MFVVGLDNVLALFIPFVIILDFRLLLLRRILRVADPIESFFELFLLALVQYLLRIHLILEWLPICGTFIAGIHVLF